MLLTVIVGVVAFVAGVVGSYFFWRSNNDKKVAVDKAVKDLEAKIDRLLGN